MTLTYCPCVVKSFLNYEDASAYVAGRDPPSQAKETPTRFYGVAIGRKPGVYTDWAKAQEAIIGWKGPKYKKFDTLSEAEAFVRQYSVGVSASETIGAEVAGLQEPPAKKAKTDTKQLISRSKVVVVYTDGSSLGNGRNGASAGVGVYFGPSDPRCVPALLLRTLATGQK